MSRTLLRTIRWILVLHILGAPWVEGMLHPAVAAPLRSFHDDVNGAVKVALGLEAIESVNNAGSAHLRGLPNRVPLFGDVNRRLFGSVNG